MKLRTSFCNKTLLRKNITRFSPVWGVYTLCLLVGMGLMYMDADNGKVNFWFASHMAKSIQIMGLVNLFFAPLTAMLLFGDLFNSRMCNAIHAMPLRRETIYATNVISGLLFSLAPTAVMAVLSLPLLIGTVVHNAWQIAFLWFVGVNLEFILFYGMAVFCIFCTGNKLGFAALYAVLNGGAFLIYSIADVLYTPMLYGVITPTRLVEQLTPIANMVDDTFVEVSNYQNMLTLFEGRLKDAVADFWVDENYYNLLVFALVGMVFLVLGLVMYRNRNLECAGDAVAVRWLEPVFQCVAAVAGGAVAMLCLEMFFYNLMRKNDLVLYILTLCGMAVGWFAGKMLLERSTRVFRLKNWRGLGVLTAIFAISLAMTHFDVLGIETWTPKPENVASVTLSCSGDIELTEQEDIENMIRLQEMALEDRLERSGAYPAAYVDSFGSVSNMPYPEEGFTYGEGSPYSTEEPHYFADNLRLEYLMKNGKVVTRNYTVWASFEEGEIIKEYISRWEFLQKNTYWGEEEPDFTRIVDFSINGKPIPKELMTEETALELMDAIKADCEDRTMACSSYYHEGQFKIPVEDIYNPELEFYYDSSLYVDITTRVGDGKSMTGCYFRVFADSANSVKWLRDHDLLPYEIVEGSFLG